MVLKILEYIQFIHYFLRLDLIIDIGILIFGVELVQIQVQNMRLFGMKSGTSFVSLADPNDPIVMGYLPTETNSSFFRETSNFTKIMHLYDILVLHTFITDGLQKTSNFLLLMSVTLHPYFRNSYK